MKKKNKKVLGPVITLLIFILIIMLLSFIFSVLKIGGSETYIKDGALETKYIGVNNLISSSGIKYILSNAIINFQKLEPVILLIIMLIGIGICEKSGLFKITFSKLKQVKTSTLIFFTVLIGIASTIVGEYSYIVLLPLVGVVYKYASRNAMVGILTMFLSIGLGYGLGLIFNYDEHLLGTLTQAAASLDVDKNYKYNLLSNIYILITGTVILSFLLSIIIKSTILPKFDEITHYEKEEVNDSKKAFAITNIVFFVMLAIIIYMIIPSLPGSGLLLDKNAPNYISSLFSNNSPFSNSLIFIISVMMMICGLVYGRISGNIKDTNEFSIGLGYSFDNLGYVFVLLFFFSQMIALLEWSNIGNVMSAILIEKISSIELSGILLIIIFFIVVIFVGLIIPSTLNKWTIMSPIVVPLFMRANITPDFTQFIFRIADGIGKTITPTYIYFFIMMAFMQKYNIENKKNITIFGTIKLMFPTILITSGLLLALIIIWYLVGIPMGLKMFPTL